MSEYKDFFNQIKRNNISRSIVIDGVVGAGKSTLVEILKDELSYTPFYEPVEDNPILDKFYYDRSRYSFPLQVFFLNKRFKMVKEASKTNSLLDRSIYGDMIFAKMLKDSGEMSEEEYELYKELACNMFEHINPPKLMVYLKNSVDCAIKKINHRGRDYEQIVEREYWENLNKEYEDYFSEYNLSPLLIIDIENLDFANNLEDRATVVNIIKQKLNSIELSNYISDLINKQGKRA